MAPSSTVRELAVDFGTSNTVAVLRTDQDPARLLLVDGWPVLPSAVWLHPDGSLVVGREAQRQARLEPARYEPNPKRRIDDVDVLLGDTVLPVVQLMAAVLRRVGQEAARQLGGEPDRVVLTHPAGWHHLRRNTLRAAARSAGWTVPVWLVAEPVAAAAHFAATSGRQLRPGEAMAVHDMGAGTTDAAVVLRTERGWQVLAEGGLPDVGGLDIDHLLTQSLVARHPELAALQRPATPADRRAAGTLAEDIRAGKEALSAYQQTDIPLPPPLPDAHLTRAELEELVRPAVERGVALLSGTIAASGLDRTQLAGIYLVGGATRMPLVAAGIAQRFGMLPVAVESPDTTVAFGALAVPVSGNGTDGTDGTDRTAGTDRAAGAGRMAGAGPRTAPTGHAPPPPHPPTRPFPAPHPAAWAPAPAAPAPPGAGRRRWVAAAGAVVVVALTVVGLVLFLPSDGPRSAARLSATTSPGTTAAATSSRSPWDADADLRRFAGVAVERAESCTDQDGAPFGARTFVRCSYPDAGTRPYYASFMSSDSTDSCEQLLTSLFTSASTNSGGNWSGEGQFGTWHDFELFTGPASAVTFWRAGNGTLCGVVEPEDGVEISVEAVHAFWNAVVRPGS